MSRIGDKIIITDNDIPRRISHEDIDQKLGTDFLQQIFW